MKNRMSRLSVVMLEPILGLLYELPDYLVIFKDIGGGSDPVELSFYHLHGGNDDELLDVEVIKNGMELDGGRCAGFFHSTRLLRRKDKIPEKLIDFDVIFPGTVLCGLGRNYWIPKLVPFGDQDGCWKQSWHPLKTGIGPHSLVAHISH